MSYHKPARFIMMMVLPCPATQVQLGLSQPHELSHVGAFPKRCGNLLASFEHLAGLTNSRSVIVLCGGSNTTRLSPIVAATLIRATFGSGIRCSVRAVEGCGASGDRFLIRLDM